MSGRHLTTAFAGAGVLVLAAPDPAPFRAAALLAIVLAGTAFGRVVGTAHQVDA